LSPFTLRRLAGGRNNRVFAVSDAAGREVVLKAYFHDADDRRDRLGAEYGFLTACERLGIDCVAKPLAKSEALHYGLYSFLKGSPPTADDITPDVLRQALDFIVRLNARRSGVELPQLPAASESCWSVADHVAKVDKRIERLSSGLGDSAIERDAAKFIADELVPSWTRIRKVALDGMAESGIDPVQTLPPETKVLSPSDFGFHNAMKGDDGRYTFFDFEYAGWDDPAKLVCDAFNQVRIPLPAAFYPTFRDAVASWFAQPDSEKRRYDLLMRVYGIKWVTIVLNEFVATSHRRRAFSEPEQVNDERLAQQLSKARIKLAHLDR
jgi:hypothetical protein